MTRKPNFAKFMLGIAVVTFLFIGTWAATSARRTNPTKAQQVALTATASTRVASNHPKMALNVPGPSTVLDPDDPRCAFQLEGDQLDSTGAYPVPTPECAFPADDWDTINCSTTDGSATKRTGVIFDDIGPSIYTGGGSKDTLDLDGWKHKSGSVPAKDEILNAYAAKYSGVPTGDPTIVFGGERASNGGAAFIGAWFFKNPVVAASDGRFRESEGGPLAHHVQGDVLVLAEFSTGGVTANVKVFEWVTDHVGNAGTNLDDITGTQGVIAQANSNADPLPAPECWTYNPGGGSTSLAIPQNAFFEGGINFAAFPELADACFSSFLIETRSSFSTGSQLKDFVLRDFNTCAAVDVTKTANPTEVCSGVSTQITYTYAVDNTSSSNEDVSVVDDNGTPADPTDDFDVVAQLPIDSSTGTPATQSIPVGVTNFQYVVTLSLTTSRTNTVQVSASAGGSPATASSSATVTVNPNPTVSIATATCSLTQPASILLDATPSGGTAPYTFAWSKDGGASFSTDEDITVSATGTYRLTVTDAKGCVSPTTSIRVGLCAGP